MPLVATMSPKLHQVLTRINAIIDDGVITPAEAVEQRCRALNTEVRTASLRALSLTLTVAGSVHRGILHSGRSQAQAFHLLVPL